MSQSIDKFRRNFVRAGISVPLLGCLPIKSLSARVDDNDTIVLSNEMLQILQEIYGRRAYATNASNLLLIKMPDLAENGSVVPFSLDTDSLRINSFVVFVMRNQNVLAARCVVQKAASLPISLRTSDIFIVADTEQGLLVNKTNVKVTIGCGGM